MVVMSDGSSTIPWGVLAMLAICLAIGGGAWWLDRREQRQHAAQERQAQVQEDVAKRIIAHVSAETEQYCPTCWGTSYAEPDARAVLCDWHQQQIQQQQPAPLNAKVVAELDEILRNCGLA